MAKYFMGYHNEDQLSDGTASPSGIDEWNNLCQVFGQRDCCATKPLHVMILSMYLP
jgi:hypothetical protein